MKNKGMTLISVIVGFALLLLGISLFYSSVQLSNKISSSQKQRIEDTEKLINQYYLIENEAIGNDIKLPLKDINGNIAVEIEVKKYTITNEAGELYYYENK